MFRTAARCIGDFIAFLGLMVELVLFASLLPGDRVNGSVAGTIVSMILVGILTGVLAIPLALYGRARVHA